MHANKGESLMKNKSVENKAVRFSGVEFLKIIAIFLICISHAVQTSELCIDYSPTLDPAIIVLKIFRYFGHFGNIIFIIASSYFLCN